MRKALVILLGLLTTAVMLGGCTWTRTVPGPESYRLLNKYLVGHYTPKPKEKYHVGKKDIKFYIVVEDHRKSKYVWIVKDAFAITNGLHWLFPTKTFIKDAKLVATKALGVTGWGITNDPTKADFILKIDITDFRWRRKPIISALLLGGFFKYLTAKADVLNNKENNLIAQTYIHESRWVVLSLSIYGVKGGPTSWPNQLYADLYQGLVKFLGSEQFAQKVFTAYAEETGGGA